MARNYIQPGDCLTLTAPAGGVVAGTPVQIGQLLVVPTTTVAAGLPFEGCTEGVFDLPKVAAQAWTEGALIYWDNTAKNCTTVSTANLRLGTACFGGQASADVIGRVRISGTAAPAGA